ncbi:MAG TPA: zinc transporter ZupT [Acholeplasmataceae bacterium]|nr:zinc transporter ZupT [Acholeplasmataceae bacterium]
MEFISLKIINYSVTEILIAFGFTIIAGLSTGLGSLIAISTKRTNTKFLSISLGFSAGVMLYVSFVEIFFKAKDAIILDLGEKLGSWITVIAFFGGMVLIALIDKLIPKPQNPHEASSVEELESLNLSPEELQESKEIINSNNLMRMGVFTALAIAIHNFPEGIATFLSALNNPKLAVAVTFAIAIHNIPEGISVYIPIYYATGSRKKAFMYSFLSGLAEPVGAIVGFLVLSPFLTNTLLGILFAAVAGIMVFISVDELLPAAREYGETHLSIYGMVGGMAVMAVSLLLFIN